MHAILRMKRSGLVRDARMYLQQLVETPSTSLSESDMADLVEAKMKELDYDKVIRDDAGNILGINFGIENAPCLMLNSHMDAVNTKAARRFGRGKGKWDGDHLYGEGTADCKGGVVAQLYAGALLKRSLLPLRGTLIVAMTVAEQNGAGIGVQSVVSETLPSLQLKPDWCVLGEPTGLGLYYGHDGWVELDVIMESENPFFVTDAAKHVFDRFAGNDVYADKKDETVMRISKPVIEHVGGRERAHIRMNRKLDYKDNAASVIQAVKSDVQQLAQPQTDVAVSVSVCEEPQSLYNGRQAVVKRIVNAWNSDPFSPVMERSRQSLIAAGCSAVPGRWKLGRPDMGTAGSVLVNDFNIPTIGYGPGEEEFVETSDEHVKWANVEESIYGTAVMAHALYRNSCVWLDIREYLRGRIKEFVYEYSCV